MTAVPRWAAPAWARLVPGAPPALCALLSAQHGPLLAPIRAELFGPDRFAQHGDSLGAAHEATPQLGGGPGFFPRLHDNMAMLRQAHAYLAQQDPQAEASSPAAEWLLDNFHTIEAQLQVVHRALPRSFYRRLPVLVQAPLAGLPRIYGVAWAFVAHTDSAFDQALLLRFLGAYQQRRALNLAELWALPTTLRAVLVENLRRLAERLATHRAAADLADLCADQIGLHTATSLQRLCDAMALRGVQPVFLAQLAFRLPPAVAGQGADAVEVPLEVRYWLQQRLLQAPAVVSAAQLAADQTADNLSVSDAVTSLRAIDHADWPEVVACTSPVMLHLLAWPLFAAEDAATRDQTLHAIEHLARRARRSESDVAQQLLRLLHQPAEAGAEPGHRLAGCAQYWLQGEGRATLGAALGLHEPWRAPWRRLRQRARLPLYLAALGLPTLALAGWVWAGAAPGLPAWAGVLLALVLLGPASEAVVAFVNRLISESLPPRRLARLALAKGLPAEHAVLVVIPALLDGPGAAQALLHQLQLHQLANPEPHAQFALLTDFADSPTAHAATDALWLEAALEQVQALNARQPTHTATPGVSRFLLLHRPRRFSTSEQAWMGWERKRGKLVALVQALASGDRGEFMDLGPASHWVPGTPYIVTLDADTQLPPGCLRTLVGVAAHPLNAPWVHPVARRVVAGHAILQPRLAAPLPMAGQASLFSRGLAGPGGLDPYAAASSEVYQDLFGEGSFTGKGLLHVAALQQVLVDRLPEGRVLSHDLLEGALARCAVVSDLVLLEATPTHPDVAAAREHRWTRGDWQLLPMLLQPRRWPLGALHRWKMFDNLRRSLVPPLALACLLWALAGGALTPGVALALVLAAFGAGPLMGALAGLAPSRDDVALRHFYRGAAQQAARAVWAMGWPLLQLPAMAWAALHAIVQALYRQAISHRGLLQWTTMAHSQRASRAGLGALWQQHSARTGAALLCWVALLASGTAWPWWSTALCALWALSPLWTWLASRPWPARETPPLSATDRAYLQALARDTWRYFERTVTADDHHLPPDNLQTAPHEMLAHRTSPTNIGLYLLSVACAQRLGFITIDELLARLTATLDSVDELERHRGHLLNWYDTQTMAPLLPRYVSTVDSGNFSGHVLALGQACLALAQTLDATPEPALARALAHTSAGDLGLSPDTALRRVQAERLRALAHRAEALAWQADYSVLYHPQRQLLHIGYRVAEQQLDAGFYDLLASESRLTSLLAIAKGDVPVRHWSALGRPFMAVGAHTGLRSWSGSMFEYLMPTLLMKEPLGSVLHSAGVAALMAQRRFGLGLGLPWGLSESAYAACDHTLAYQYAPHGVPRLALRRSPVADLVVAPYASVLALMVDPQAATQNLRRLQGEGARSALGFIEALDYSPALLPVGQRHVGVYTCMAHHQGMSLLALTNTLLDGQVQTWGMASPALQAVASLLHESAPSEVPTLPRHLAAAPALPGAAVARPLLHPVLPAQQALGPTQLLSNGRYHVALRANGAGSSRLLDQALTRVRDDALQDACGSFFYLRGDLGLPAVPQLRDGAALPLSLAPGHGGQPVSITQHPAPDPRARYSSVLHADRQVLEAAWPGLHCRLTVWVSPEDDVEFRQVELCNDGTSPLTLELISAFEVALSSQAADESHPAFNNLFVTARWLPQQQALWFERQPRLATETPLYLAHFLAEQVAPAVPDQPVLPPPPLLLQGQAARMAWCGRGRAPSVPLASLVPLPNQGPPLVLDTQLDPVCVLGVPLHIPAQGQVRLVFATAASRDALTLHAMVDKYRQPSHTQRASLMSATLAVMQMRSLGLDTAAWVAVQTLTTALAQNLSRCATRLPWTAPWPDERLAPPASLQTAQRQLVQPAPAASQYRPATPCDRRLLWRLGLSGERPLLLVQADRGASVGLLRTLAQALRLWNWGGQACDLVVVNTEPVAYLMPLHATLTALRDRYRAEAGDRGCAWVLLQGGELSAAELGSLQALARLQLLADGRSLAQAVATWAQRHETALQQRLAQAPSLLPLAGPVAAGSLGASAPSHPGHFAPGHADFSFQVGPQGRPARPWVNVLANPGFGALFGDSGPGYTWAGNSRLQQLTTWSNDPVADPPPAWLLLQDLATGQVWSATANAWALPGATYDVTHGAGFTRTGHHRGALQVVLEACVDVALPLQQWRLQLHNQGSTALQLRVVAGAEWQLGERRSDRFTVHTQAHRQRLPQGRLTALLATQTHPMPGQEPQAGAGPTAWLACVDSGQAEDWTCDRREFFSTSGARVLPAVLGRTQGPGLDPCAALGQRLQLAPGARLECVFLLGHAASPEAAMAQAARATDVPAVQRVQAQAAFWDPLLAATTVNTPDALFDGLVNRWLLYQAISCRLWAKAGLYQAGGATGFRDQLQDCLALAWAAPAMLREQVLRCAGRQFAEGDVQHWWHEPGGAGVRTRSSDDLLWLPHALLHYLAATGDHSLLEVHCAFLTGPPVPPDAEDLYFTPGISEAHASVYEHAARALDLGLRSGAHGLPLMGGGDWNDGMNTVGPEGRGESVWLAWFLLPLVAGMAPLAHARLEHARAARWEAAADGWRQATEAAAWDGHWYRRAFFDDGSVLGGQANAEARIDLIAQAWAVLSQAAPAHRQQQAMQSLREHLADAPARLLHLLDPPLAHAQPSAGYIQAYPPGVRENGGQYSHAAVWALMAQAQLESQGLAAASDLPYRWFTWVSPAHRSADATVGPLYGLEPYAVAGDVCSAPPHTGRGGWSWYTGAAAWLHRAAVGALFGLQQDAEHVWLHPALPAHWPSAEISLRRGERVMHFLVLQGATEDQVQADSQPLQAGERVAWTGLPATSRFVLRLPTRVPSPPVQPDQPLAVDWA